MRREPRESAASKPARPAAAVAWSPGKRVFSSSKPLAPNVVVPEKPFPIHAPAVKATVASSATAASPCESLLVSIPARASARQEMAIPASAAAHRVISTSSSTSGNTTFSNGTTRIYSAPSPCPSRWPRSVANSKSHRSMASRPSKSPSAPKAAPFSGFAKKGCLRCPAAAVAI